jgi:hypothetical protein
VCRNSFLIEEKNKGNMKGMDEGRTNKGVKIKY